jgi:hypothetical protein
MKRMIFAALLIAAPVFAQPEEQVKKLIRLHYAEPSSVQNMLMSYGVGLRADNQMKAIAISGRAADVAACEAAIKLLDVAPKNIELVVYFVVGSDQPNLTGTAVPTDVRDVITQLKNVFTFKDYRMLDTLTVRTRTGTQAETSGILDASGSPRLSVFSIRNSTVSEDGASIRIDRLHAGLRIPVPRAGTDPKSDYMNTGIDQDIDVKEGQKVVVGRSSLQGPEKALFLILTAKVIQ